MARKKTHRAYAEGQRWFFRQLMKKYNKSDKFDSSVFSKPRLSSLPSSEEALGTERLSMPDLTIEDSQPLSTDPPPPSTDQTHPPEKLLHQPKTLIKPPPTSCKKPARAVKNFFPTRTRTHPLSLSVTARKPDCSGGKLAQADTRKVPKIISNTRTKMDIQRVPYGYTLIIYD